MKYSQAESLVASKNYSAAWKLYSELGTYKDSSDKILKILNDNSKNRAIDGMMMVFVPEGPFTMGSDNGSADEQPVHTVSLSEFWIDQTEVTNGKYALCVLAEACTQPANLSSRTRSSYYGDSQFIDFPVIHVDWNQAKSYCQWAGARLPTEAEWEKAARGTDGRSYPWGENIDKGFANYAGSDTAQAGSYESGKSPYGAYDMAGNVQEWVEDWYGPYSNSPVTNPTGPASGDQKVLRGGSWIDFSLNLRVSYRYRYSPGGRYFSDGFRCAR